MRFLVIACLLRVALCAGFALTSATSLKSPWSTAGLDRQASEHIQRERLSDSLLKVF